MPTGRRLSLGFLVVGMIVIVILVFGTTFLVEKTLFTSASKEALSYLHITRGLVASSLVAMTGLLFLIFERRRIEIEHRKLLKAVEQSPITILVADRDGKIEYVNPRFSALTGYRREEVIGKTPRILKSGQTPPEKYKNLWKSITSGKEWSGEFLNKKKNGELYWEDCSISPILDAHGTVTHFVGVLEDISNRKKMDELKDSFLGMVSHQLRTPLAIIKFSAVNLLDELSGPLEKEQKETIGGIVKNCRRLQHLVEDLLDLSRLESGKSKINLKSVDVGPIIQETVDQFRKAMANHTITVKEELPAVMSSLHVDEELFIQLISNLLDNAMRFAKSRVVVRARFLNANLQVSVIDDGPGISEEDLKRLFRKYEQARQLYKKKGYKGTGLGLAICKEIAEQHGGKIWAESKIGEGAAFQVLLPLQAPSNEETELNISRQGRSYEEQKREGAYC